jgi:hypothetical protein
VAEPTKYEDMSASEKKKEDWMNSKWRPMMGWSYMLTCITDFVVFPVLWSVLQSISKGQVNVQWQPITLQGAGLYHIAMGAVLGIAAYGRTQEKLGGANNGGIQAPGTGFASGPSTFSQPAAGGFGSPGGFNSPAPVSNSFGAQPLGNGSGFGNTGFGATAGGTTAGGFGAMGNVAPGADFSAPAQVTLGFGGKKAPPEAPQPLI